MSFRKRNIIINRGPPSAPIIGSPISPPPTPPQPTKPPPPPGVRPSPINGQPTTSTGTPSLDSLLAGHSGLPLGCSLLIEEPGATDFGGALLRYYAAEGIVQGHAVTVVGFGENWVRDLPAVTGDAEDDGKSRGKTKEGERMKIAWRYERLGEFGSGIGGSRAQNHTLRTEGSPKDEPPPTSTTTTTATQPFCHSFDLTKRLTIPSGSKLTFIPAPLPSSTSPFSSILSSLSTHISTHPPTLPHRIIIPSLLSPLLYPPHCSSSTHLLPFLHTLRSLLRLHPHKLTLMLSIPLELYPRDSGLLRWAEILSDGVVELTPLPHQVSVPQKAGEDASPQGLVKLWKLPVLGEKGGGIVGAGGAGEDLAFTVTRKRFEIRAYSLPPMDEGEDHTPGLDDHSGHGHSHGGKATKVDVEF